MSPDYVEAMKWFRNAAEQNHEPAQFKLGEMYYRGEGVQRDYVEALKWYRKTADRHYKNDESYDLRLLIDSQFKLAEMYCRGEGVPRDYVEAYMWLVIVLGKARFEEKAAELCSKLAAKMTQAQIGEALRLAKEWTESSAS
jgi:TPR repeat protein